MANSSSLSNVVSSLVRAQMGSSIPTNTLDEELDRRVAELILKEAKRSETRYGMTGSYSPQPASNGVKTNKRFLTSIIKSTDEHNKAILRAQAEAANEVKQQREREEREERMRRAQEAVDSRRRSSPTSKHYEDYERHGSSREESERRHSSGHSRKRRRDRHFDSESEQDHRNKRSRRDGERRKSLSPGHDKRKGREHEDGKRSSHRSSRKDKHHEEERNHRKSHRKSRSRSPTRDKHRKREEGSSKASSSTRHHSSREERVPSRSDSLDKSRSKSTQEPQSVPREVHDPSTSKAIAGVDESVQSDEEIGPRPVATESSPKQFPSKMDKYFAEDYDPRMDVTTSLMATDGFIPPGAFDNWDFMLQVVRRRNEEKEEKKRLEKVHRGSSSGKSKKEKSDEVADLLSMQYTKKGGVREWDEGKEVT